MSCYYCNQESIYTESAVPCVVCNYPACPHPSGRPDHRFHGERCGQTGCNLFVCEYDVHQHASKVLVGGGPSAVPTCFPYLTVGASFGALQAAEASLGERKAVATPQVNRALTRATHLLEVVTPEQREQLGKLATEVVKDEQGASRAAYQVQPDYLDVVRIVRLCLKADTALTEASQQLPGGSPHFVPTLGRPQRMDFASDSLNDRMIHFVESAQTKAHGISARLGILSDRLGSFIEEVLGLFPERYYVDSEPTFDIRKALLGYQPSSKVRHLDQQLDEWEWNPDYPVN